MISVCLSSWIPDAIGCNPTADFENTDYFVSAIFYFKKKLSHQFRYKLPAQKCMSYIAWTPGEHTLTKFNARRCKYQTNIRLRFSLPTKNEKPSISNKKMSCIIYDHSLLRFCFFDRFGYVWSAPCFANLRMTAIKTYTKSILVALYGTTEIKVPRQYRAKHFPPASSSRFKSTQRIISALISWFSIFYVLVSVAVDWLKIHCFSFWAPI